MGFPTPEGVLDFGVAKGMENSSSVELTTRHEVRLEVGNI